MKTLLKPVYLSIAASVLVALLLIWVVFSGDSAAQDAETVKIARDPTFYPVDLRDKTRQFLAFSDELVNSIARRSHTSVQFLDESSDRLYVALNEGSVSAILTANNPTDGFSLNQFLNSDPYYDVGVVLVVRADSTISSMQEMSGKVVGVVRGVLAPSDLNIDSTVYIVSYDSALDALVRLADHSLDAVLLPFFSAYTVKQSLFSGRIKIATRPLKPRGVRLVTKNNKSGQQLIDLFNSGLEAMRQDGNYEVLLHRWALPDPEKP